MSQKEQDPTHLVLPRTTLPQPLRRSMIAIAWAMQWISLLVVGAVVFYLVSSQAEAFTASHRILPLLGGGLLIFAALLMVTTVRLLDWRIFQPIRQLQAGAERIGQGDLDHRIAIIRQDEIGQVAAAFNEMAARLCKQYTEFQRVETVNDQLEQEIAERKRVEEALRESHQLLEKTFASLRDAVFIIDADTTEIMDCNPAASEIFGYSREEMLGRTTAFLHVNETTLAEFRGHLYPAVAEKGFLFLPEFRMKRKDGTVFPTEHSVMPLENAQGKRIGWVSVVRDITERKRAEEALRRQAEELTALQKTLLDIAAFHDLPTLLQTIVERAALLLNAPSGGLYLCDPDRREVRCVVSYGTPRDYTGTVLKYGEGAAGTVAQTGEPLIIDDYRTWSRRAAVFEGEQPFTAVLSAPMIWQGQVTGVIHVLHNVESRRFTEADLELLTSFANHAAIAVENARLVEALRQRTTELEARNEELDAFAHTVAHDLKSPLTLIIGFAELLSTEHTALPAEEVLHYVHKIAQGGHRMRNIVDELLLLAEVRKAEVEMKPLDMASIVAEAWERLAYMFEESQAEIVMPEAWPAASGHAPWVEEVWVNYISNAIKYGGRPPRVELGFSIVEAPPGEDQSQIKFWVRDNGPGLTPEEQARLFTPFTRLDQVRARGHGLGLSVVRRIVEKLGGQVGVESEVGRGSVFYFTLPAA